MIEIETILSLVKDIEKYEAHVKEEKNEQEEKNKGNQKKQEKKILKREKLSDHIKLTCKYFQYIWKEKRIFEMKDRFISQRWGALTEEANEFFDEMIWGIAAFHDLGKINPAFQQQQMKNEKVTEENIFKVVGKQHSIISAVLYMDYFFDKLRKSGIDKQEKKELYPFVFYHAYIIERHHSDLGNFANFLQSLEVKSGKDVMEIFQEKKCDSYQKNFYLDERKLKRRSETMENVVSQLDSKEKQIGVYAYVKMLYSVLVSSDYYATSEFESETKIEQIGNLEEIEKWIQIYENTKLMKTIRNYQREVYPKPIEKLKSEKNMNDLRTEMLIDAERVLEENKEQTLFYLEAPTGSGKSNTALNLSFKMIEKDKRLKKIYYIYPFNTLVEQNIENLKKIFAEEKEIFSHISVVNSITPIKSVKKSQKAKEEESESEQTKYYQKALLDRQFLNYPMIVSTHVSLFDTMFGDTKESAFAFHQLMNSVIVLDEIQSYKNNIWGEIICFLKEFSYLLNIKVLIMSATLPDLDFLSEHTYQAVKLIKDREKYFSNLCFKNRVEISYELLELLKDSEKEKIEEKLLEHVQQSASTGKKVLVEFISKESASAFFRKLKEKEEIGCEVEYISGEDNVIERSRILKKVKQQQGAIILVGTQVIEAGVDIDMDIGYKNISKLDSEEQFLGRINRSCLRNGTVYFFKLDEVKDVYKEDIRKEKRLTLENDEMREILISKNFSDYYEKILKILKTNYNENSGDVGLTSFFSEQTGKLNWSEVKEKMKLINDDEWSMSVYLARKLKNEEGIEIDGAEVWKEYVKLLQDFKMDYAEKRVKMSEIKSQMNYFIYQIKKIQGFVYNDKVGELFFIADGEEYFEDGKLNKEKLKKMEN